MAHEITTRADGFAEMAFIGQTPWHGLGQRVSKGAPLETWMHQSGLDWQACRAVAQYMVDTPTGEQVMRQWDDKTVLYRSDNGAPIGMVSPDYKIVQPVEVFEFFRDLTESGDWHIHTAGSLGGGRKLWCLASNHTEGEVVPGDRVRGNLLLATSMDGSMRTVAAMTAIRVVCANTLRLALQGLGADSISVSHRTTFDADAAKAKLGVARDSFADFMVTAQQMAQTGIGQDEARETLRRIFGQPTVKAPPVPAGTASTFAELLSKPIQARASDAVMKEKRNVETVLSLFNGGARGSDHAGSKGTRWGLFNSVTEFVDHEMGRTDNARLDAAWFGRSHDMKAQAFELLSVAS